MDVNEAPMTMASDHIDELRDGMTQARAAIAEARIELERLRRIENAALRVASSRRLSEWSQSRIVDDQHALDALDAALEATS